MFCCLHCGRSFSRCLGCSRCFFSSSSRRSGLSLQLGHLCSHVGRRGSSSEHLLQLHHLGDAVDHLLHQLHFRETQSLLVGHVELGALGSGVFSRGSSGLQVEGRAHLLQQLLVFLHSALHQFVELRKHDHDGGAKTRSQVGGTGPHKSEGLVPHELGAVRFCRGLDCVREIAEPREHRGNVSAQLHGDDAAVVFLVHPAQCRLGLVVEDASVVGPRASSSGSRQ
mmetsp:Transcript_24412/g.40729  ORF Transcript_24412/g.40729 Transcript_24412/m.40729 type:complete len:225 (-) Transcript_24412:878-1552(-)